MNNISKLPSELSREHYEKTRVYFNWYKFDKHVWRSEIRKEKTLWRVFIDSFKTK